MNQALSNKVQHLPVKSGVYLYKNQSGEIIYVGKAVRLRQRVQQYFSKHMRDNKTLALVNEIADLDWIQTESELDALILEAELIKRHQPRYNVLLRDDKSNIYIKITLYKTVPDITLVHLPDDDKATYFGPYYNAYPIRQALRYLRRIFPYFTQAYDVKYRSSLYRQIGLEPDITTPQRLKNYRRDLKRLVGFLSGGRLKVASELEKAMQQAASRQDFEMAALYRNKLYQLRSLQYRIHLQESSIELVQRDPGLKATQQLFGLEAIPQRIEGYDISHLGGTNVVASMVVFINGLPSRPDYRRFKIRIDQNNDVAAMREVIARRFQSTNLAKWGEPDLVLIDGGRTQLASVIKQLALIKKTHLPVFSLAEKQEEVVVNQLSSNVKLSANLPVYSLGGDYVAVTLPKNHSALKLFQRIRDEAHRFAINYQSELKRRQQLRGSLDDIKGIGPATRAKLQRSFGSIPRIAQASLTEMAAIIGIHKAKLVLTALNDSTSQSSK